MCVCTWLQRLTFLQVPDQLLSFLLQCRCSGRIAQHQINLHVVVGLGRVKPGCYAILTPRLQQGGHAHVCVCMFVCVFVCCVYACVYDGLHAACHQ